LKVRRAKSPLHELHIRPSPYYPKEEVSHGLLGLERGSDRDKPGLVILQIKEVELRRGSLLELASKSASLLSELRNGAPVSSPETGTTSGRVL
jgi:hypothetical protein